MEFAIVDIETTGGNASNSSIIEIAIIVIKNNRIIERYNSLFNPQRIIPHFITSLTGITNEMVANAPDFEDEAYNIYKILKDRIFVAHNVNFDYSFVYNQLNYFGYKLSNRKLCTIKLLRKAFPGYSSYSLGRICESLKVPHKNKHRAMGDAEATALLFKKIVDKTEYTIIDKFLKKTEGLQNLPPNLKPEQFTNLPQSFGVYFFKNEAGKIIYIGKANNLKKRVASHFSGNNTGARRQAFLKEIFAIDYINCLNELESFVRECIEIHKHWPKYNYAQKKYQPQYGVYCYEDYNGFNRLAIAPKKKVLQSIYSFNLISEGRVILRKLSEQFKIKSEFVGLDSLPDETYKIITRKKHNNAIKKAIDSLQEKLQSYVIYFPTGNDLDYLVFVVYKGCFKGYKTLHLDYLNMPVSEWLHLIEPCIDNDYLRGLLYNYKLKYPNNVIEI